MRLLHLLPRVPPAVCGVADYAWNLAGALRNQHQIESVFLSAETHRDPSSAERSFPVHRLPARTRQALVDWMRGQSQNVDALLLHLSPYGFQKRALPFWLAAAWQDLAHQDLCRNRLVFFHELYASGPPTTSAFWLQPFQKLILQRLAKFSTGTLTNRQAYAEWIDHRKPALAPPTETIPVFSNLGECAEFVPFQHRQAEGLFFISANHERGPIEPVLEQALQWAKKLGMRQMHLVGRVPSTFQKQSSGVAVECHGYLPQQEAMTLLARCQMGFTAYTPSYLAKSGLLAAMASFGLAVVSLRGHRKLTDGLVENQHLLCADAPDVPCVTSPAERESLGRKLFEWYQPHSLARTADRYAAALSRLTSGHVEHPVEAP